MYGNTKE